MSNRAAPRPTFPGWGPPGPSAAELQRQLASWTATVQHHDTQLLHAARLATLGEMAAGVAHEINQPLATIQMLVTHMLVTIEREHFSVEQARKWLDTINEQIDRISWIIGHLRSFSRSDAPELPLGASLNETVHNVLRLVRTQLHTHGIAVEATLDESLPRVRGDPRRLEQLGLNLLTNARDALDTLPTGTDRRVRIRTYARPDRDLAVLEVHDTGPGIPEEIRDRIFEPFFTTKSAGKGTGLGLPIVRTIVGESGGHIALESEPGTGTTFRVMLPVAEAAEDSTEATP